ncbi:hypothetical protein IGI67_005063 [Enterococcus sp. AZ196]
MGNVNHIIKKPLQPPKAFFDWCLSHIPNYRWENKKETILASNRENCPIIVKRLSARSLLNIPEKAYFFAIVLVTKKRIEIQSYVYWSEVRDGKQVIESRMSNLERFSNGKHIKAHKRNDEWYEGLLQNYGFMSSAYTNSNFYPNDWQDKAHQLKELQYLEIENLNRHTLPKYFKYHKEIEYCQKIGAKLIANEIIEPDILSSYNRSIYSIDLRVCTWNWLRKNKQSIKNSNKSFNDVQMEHLIRKRNGKPIEGIGKYLNYREFKQIPKEVNITKFQHWVMKGKFDFQTYKDYLAMLDELKIPKNSELVFMPRDLRDKHDDLAKTITKIKQAKRNDYLNSVLESRAQYEMKQDDYTFIVPKTLREIVEEGSALEHCVGGNYYLERHKKGETTIVFMRKTTNIDTPLYTIEYRNGKIIQIQGKRNRIAITNDIQATADKWAKKVQRTEKA